MPSATLDQTSELLRLLGDPTRVRLLALLAREELTVAEITRITRLAQSRASSHLARLKEAGLVRDRRDGASNFYALNEERMPDTARTVWENVRASLRDPVVEDDRERLDDVLAARHRVRGRGAAGTWADSVAGKMDRHYSPGRTWEATAWALLGLARVGDVLDVASGDGVIAALLAPRARSVTCIDRSGKVIRAARERLRQCRNVRFEQADMHDLPFAEASFDAAVLTHALTFARDPERVLAELARVLKPGGALVAATLKRHPYRAEVESYDHLSTGFEPRRLAALLARAGFAAELCEVTSQERRRPHFEVITIHARRAAGARAPQARDGRPRAAQKGPGRSRP